MDETVGGPKACGCVLQPVTAGLARLHYRPRAGVRACRCATKYVSVETSKAATPGRRKLHAMPVALPQDPLTVLMVDDDAELAAGGRAAARARHACALRRHRGPGLADLTRLEPDVLLLDLMLPDANGIDLCRRLRESGHELPVLMLTARGDPSTACWVLSWAPTTTWASPSSHGSWRGCVRAGKASAGRHAPDPAPL
jgi:CheY-like chemotaxis protein